MMAGMLSCRRGSGGDVEMKTPPCNRSHDSKMQPRRGCAGMFFYTYVRARAHACTWKVVTNKTPLIPAGTQNYKEYKELRGGDEASKIPATSPPDMITSPLRWTS